MLNKNILDILLIEDDTIEVIKFNRVISLLKLDHKVIEAHDGEKALSILEQTNVLPSLILLDLNMSRMNGIEFLNVLKKKEKLRCIPVVILTTSSNRKDISNCCKLGVAGYILKPLKYDDYVSAIETLFAYWNINEIAKK